MPSKSKRQQRFFGLLKSIREGDTPSGKVRNYKDLKEKSKDLTMKQIDDFAGTKHKGLPEQKKKKKKKKKSFLQIRNNRIKMLKAIINN